MKIKEPHMNFAEVARAWLVATLMALALLCRVAPATAADNFAPPVMIEAQMAQYVAALPEIAAAKAAAGGNVQATNLKLWRKIAGITKQHGFATYEDFVVLSATVAVILTGIDPTTKVFTEPKIVLEQQISAMADMIEELKTDLMAAPEKPATETVMAQLLPLTRALDGLKEARKSIPVTTDPKNVELVTKYFNKLVAIANPRQVPK
jgi:hypothetical protein